MLTPIACVTEAESVPLTVPDRLFVGNQLHFQHRLTEYDKRYSVSVGISRCQSGTVKHKKDEHGLLYKDRKAKTRENVKF